jgi:hypothetical protein
MAQNRTCNLSVTGRPSSPLRHVFKVPRTDSIKGCEVRSSLHCRLDYTGQHYDMSLYKHRAVHHPAVLQLVCDSFWQPAGARSL